MHMLREHISRVQVLPVNSEYWITMKVLVLTVIAIIGISNAKKLEEKYSWKELDFAWPSEEVKQEAIKTGRYIEGHNLPLGLDVWKDKVFITVPRYVCIVR